MFGGGRYNGLAGIFGGSEFPAVGCAPGDETTRLFLESWGLVDAILSKTTSEVYYLPIIDESVADDARSLAKSLRAAGVNVVLGLQPEGIGKALEAANKQGYQKVVLFGSDEVQKQVYQLKDMESGKQEEIAL